MMVHLNKDMYDVVGNKYLKEGFVKANKFVKNRDIRYGLFGIPWGRTYEFPYEDIKYGYWSVVKTEINDDYIRIYYSRNRFKFRSGLVMHMGSIKTASNFVLRTKNKLNHFFHPQALTIKKEEVVGSKEWFKKVKKTEFLSDNNLN